MIKSYELWLDESGKFEDEQAKKEKENPSLIGGLLIETEKASRLRQANLIPDARNHATEMRKEEKRKYLIETLEAAREYGARLFYIENPNYESEGSNSELYLKMMAEGILQLLQVLNAYHEGVELKVLIAQRQDFRRRVRIDEREYIAKLDYCIKKKQKANHILFDAQTKLSFKLDQAKKRQELELADYASYVRFRRNNEIFAQDRARLKALFEDAYLFTAVEEGTVSYINRLLSNDMVADAAIEAFTTTEKIDRGAELKKICTRMKNMSYRLVKAQLKQFSADMIAYTAAEDDYEVGERLLKKIIKEWLPMLRECDFLYAPCGFQLLLQLTDMYLREGDIIAARETMQQCRQMQQEIGNALEEVFSYYQMNEKEAVLLIDEFRYREASELMERICGFFENIMSVVISDENLKERFPFIRSEYFGDALCMKIYADMFLQREDTTLYESLCKASDLALKQYPQMQGELERHRQYRSHIEAEAGNYKEALQWLIQARLYKKREIDTEAIREFLHVVETTEYRISCQYYLMYYLIIMAEAKRKQDSLADEMYQALSEFQGLLQIAELDIDKTTSFAFENVDISRAVNKVESNYHPMEINQWKYASYLYHAKAFESAEIYFQRAYRLCTKYSNYTTMNIVGSGILAERICCCIDSTGLQTAQKHYKELLSHIDRILDVNLPEQTKAFLRGLKEMAISAGQNGKIDKEKMMKLSRKITY